MGRCGAEEEGGKVDDETPSPPRTIILRSRCYSPEVYAAAKPLSLSLSLSLRQETVLLSPAGLAKICMRMSSGKKIVVGGVAARSGGESAGGGGVGANCSTVFSAVC